VSQRRKIWGLLGRLFICGLLLAAIFNAIFKKESEPVWTSAPHERAWADLHRWEQWQFAWTHGPGALWRTLRQIDAGSLAISHFWMAAILLLGVLRWRMVLQVHGLQLPLARAASISMVAQFFNSVLLGSTGGDLIKAYYAARETHHKKTEAVMTVFVDRLIGLFSMLFFACAMMLPSLPILRQPDQIRLAAWSLVIVAMTLGCGCLVAISFWGGISRQVPNARIWLRRIPKGELMEKGIDACRVFGRNPGFILRTMGISMVVNAACVLQITVLARGLGLSVPAPVMFLIVPMIICISALPFSPPGGLGLRENLFVLLLVPLGVNETKALSLSLLAYSVFVTWSLIGGVIYFTVRQRQHLDEMARENPEAV
jgi:glycosyltransferase 2 family protein